MKLFLLTLIAIIVIYYFFLYSPVEAAEGQKQQQKLPLNPVNEFTLSIRDDDKNVFTNKNDTCAPKQEEEDTQIWPLKSGQIFVSIASYRDEACKDTVYDLFEKAFDQSRIRVGVAQQNNKDFSEEDCFDKCEVCSQRKKDGQIRVINMRHLEAKGPQFARSVAAKLWRGEEFFLQIDSHIQFEKDWDKSIIEQWRSLNDPKAVLSHYPPSHEKMNEILKNGSTPVNCRIEFSSDGIPKQKAVYLKVPENKFPKGFYVGANLFAPATVLREVPWDPYLTYVFFSEEILLSVRLYTHGYNFYAPRVPIFSHDYRPNPRRPRFSQDLKQLMKTCEERGKTRTRFLLGLIPYEEVDPAYRARLHKYGLGTERTLEDYYKFSGIDVVNKKAEDMCSKVFK